jgi:hypothetical protein
LGSTPAYFDDTTGFVKTGSCIKGDVGTDRNAYEDRYEMSNKIFCGGLSWDTNDQGLQAAMTEFGPVREAKVITDRDTGRSKGFGFVTFEDAADAESAVAAGSLELDGRTVRIDLANDKPRGGGRGGRGGGGGGRGGGGGGRDDRY